MERTWAARPDGLCASNYGPLAPEPLSHVPGGCPCSPEARAGMHDVAAQHANASEMMRLTSAPNHPCRAMTGDAWDPKVAEPGEVVLMPTYRFAYLHAVEEDGRRTFVTAQGILLCEHGEKACTINSWLHRERRAEHNGEAAPPRNSICDCRTAERLWATVPPPTEVAPLPESLYGHLCETGKPKMDHKGREARQLPWSGGVHLTTMGKLVCKHGLSIVTLADKRRAIDGRKCTCKPWCFPKRVSREQMQLGRFKTVRGQSRCPQQLKC